jgi:hypothetical protein
MNPQRLASAVGALRLGIGAALVAAPRFAGNVWIGEGAAGRGTDVFARALGARDLLLGAQTLAAVRSEKASRHLLQQGFAADAADAVATALAFKSLTPGRRWLMPVVAGAVAFAGYEAARHLD